AAGFCGGQAFSIPLDAARFGTSWLNQGVQGGHDVYHHTFHFMRQHGFKAKRVNLSFSFGKGDQFWTNVYPTEFLRDHGAEVKKFKRAVETMRKLEAVFGIWPVRVTLKLWGFSEEFVERMVYPTLSLWFGTGNTTPNAPTAMLIAFFTNPHYGMWRPIDQESLIAHQPEMRVFPNMTDFYTTWKHALERRRVSIRFNTRVTSVVSRSSNQGVKVTIVKRRLKSDVSIPAAYLPDGDDKDAADVVEAYDEVVLCVGADAALKILGENATRIERKVLGRAKYSDDVTVTHCDTAYMKRHYEPEFLPEVAVYSLGTRDERTRVEEASRSFSPMYYVKHDELSPDKIEMSFNCSQFQPQLKQQNKPFRDQVFQTVFLNDENRARWSKNEIDSRKMIRVDEFHQIRQGWQHYAFVVPFLSWLQSRKRHTHFAGAWTLMNAHEVAMMSGLAAAAALGAGYPVELERDQWATTSFEAYYKIVYGKKETARLIKERRKANESKSGDKVKGKEKDGEKDGDKAKKSLGNRLSLPTLVKGSTHSSSSTL
ncbi:hypothetical protein JCM10212_001103, partial [Sporobolomyces blumeae]